MINKAWHTKTVKECLDLLKTAPEGLPGPEVSLRQDKYGLNKIEEGGRKGPLSMLLSQFKDIMILILIGAAAISAVAGDLKDTIVILVIVFLNALVGFIQEYRAEKAMHALKKMSAARAKVLRDGRTHTINAEELVPGDIVMLEAGDIIPADLRLMEAHSLMTEEASLTGESFPVKKTTEPVPDEKIPLGDRLNIAFKSTLVTYGRGKGVVVGTGMNTEIGSIAGMLQGKDSLTPLQHRLKVFARKLSFVVIGICIVIFFLGLQRGEDPVSMLLTALSVAVAAIPEALPAVITIALSLGAKKLVKQNALIRKLPAVETLGAVTFICSDKTGTLTQNKMTVKEVRLPEEKILDETDNDSLLKISMLLNQDTRLENNRVIGDPTETALVEYALRSRDLTDKVKSLHRVAELPFDSDRKLMTTIHNWGSGFLVVTKGALEAVLSKCPAPGTDEILQEAAKLGEKGMRILGFAVKIINVLPEDLTHEEVEKELSFLGFCGMIDPPRIEAKQAVAECVRAGIIPVMITGDHPVTAKAIAKEIGILSAPEQEVITGVQLSEISEESFKERVENIRVYARVSPAQKLQIVTALQNKGHFAAMTGDGVNDAPALRRANIGIAMGITGTEVSKEAAHMILLDDNFATIVKAVKEGRRVYDNLRKFIRFVLTGNSAEIFTILLSPLLGLPVALLPIQILWINLVTDGLPGLAFSFEPAEKNAMSRPPRHPDETIFSQGLGSHILWVGLLIAGLCLGLQYWAVQNNNPSWQTLVFTCLCFCQMSHALAVRSETHFLYRQGLLTNRHLILSVAVTLLLQIIIIYVPALASIFKIQPLSFQEFALCAGAGIIVFHAVEFEKYFRNKNLYP